MIIAIPYGSRGTYNALDIPLLFIGEGGFGFAGAGSNVTYSVSASGLINLLDA